MICLVTVSSLILTPFTVAATPPVRVYSSLVCAWLSTPEQAAAIDVHEIAQFLRSPLAQRKDVGSRPYAVLLNQSDRARPDEIAALATLLLQKGVERVVTAALQRRPGEYEVWKR